MVALAEEAPASTPEAELQVGVAWQQILVYQAHLDMIRQFDMPGIVDRKHLARDTDDDSASLRLSCGGYGNLVCPLKSGPP